MVLELGPGIVINGDPLLVFDVAELERARVGNLLEGLASIPGDPVTTEIVAVGNRDLSIGVEVRPERVEGEHRLVDTALGVETKLGVWRVRPARRHALVNSA